MADPRDRVAADGRECDHDSAKHHGRVGGRVHVPRVVPHAVHRRIAAAVLPMAGVRRLRRRPCDAGRALRRPSMAGRPRVPPAFVALTGRRPGIHPDDGHVIMGEVPIPKKRDTYLSR